MAYFDSRLTSTLRSRRAGLNWQRLLAFGFCGGIWLAVMALGVRLL